MDSFVGEQTDGYLCECITGQLCEWSDGQLMHNAWIVGQNDQWIGFLGGGLADTDSVLSDREMNGQIDRHMDAYWIGQKRPKVGKGQRLEDVKGWKR